MADEKLVQKWRMIFRRFDASGVPVRAFCLREQLTQSNFYYWRKRLLEATAVKSSASVEFVEIGGAAAGAIELVTKDGLTIRLSRDFDEATLKRVLGVLGRDR